MNQHRFILQPYRGLSSRFRCPQCQHHTKSFKRYIDLETYGYLADHVGRCDREEKCGYHFTPRRYFTENPGKVRPSQAGIQGPLPIKSQFNHLNIWLVEDSMIQKAYIHNNFILFLAEQFGWEQALQAAERYKIGTSKHWPGANVFWQVDIKGKVRTGKVMLYDKLTGKRVKQPFNHIAWVHTLVKFMNPPNNIINMVDDKEFGDYKLQQCFFGEHLLSENKETMVGITESEKTAVMASIMMPQLVWLAAGSLHGLDDDKCKALQNRTILLFPDVGAYTYWTERARTLNLKIPTATFAVHDEMEKTATDIERASGADMADRWVRQ